MPRRNASVARWTVRSLSCLVNPTPWPQPHTPRLQRKSRTARRQLYAKPYESEAYVYNLCWILSLIISVSSRVPVVLDDSSNVRRPCLVAMASVAPSLPPPAVVRFAFPLAVDDILPFSVCMGSRGLARTCKRLQWVFVRRAGTCLCMRVAAATPSSPMAFIHNEVRESSLQQCCACPVVCATGTEGLAALCVPAVYLTIVHQVGVHPCTWRLLCALAPTSKEDTFQGLATPCHHGEPTPASAASLRVNIELPPAGEPFVPVSGCLLSLWCSGCACAGWVACDVNKGRPTRMSMRMMWCQASLLHPNCS